MAKDTQSRKWQLTINNPVEKGFTHDKLREIVGTMSSGNVRRVWGNAYGKTGKKKRYR